MRIALIAIFLSVTYLDSSGQQPTAIIKGRVIQSITKTPVCHADITCSDRTSFTKSNADGEFIIYPSEMPVSFRIAKFGFEEETVLVRESADSILISLNPLVFHKNSSGLKENLEYELLLKKALEKIKVLKSEDPFSERKLVYCRAVSMIDSSINSFFESFSRMSASKGSLKDNVSEISRFASTNESVPGLSENKLEFEMDPFINLPMFIERFIERRGYFTKGGKVIAVLYIDLGKTKNVYYINVADTSIIHIKSYYESGNRQPLQMPGTAMKNYRISTSIDLVQAENSEEYIIGYVSQNEEIRLIRKNTPGQIILKNSLFSIVPDSSLVCNAVREQVLYESLAESRQQFDFFSKIIPAQSSGFSREMEKLLLKPYKQDFWNHFSYVTLDPAEKEQIRKWENENNFYSENRFPSSVEIANPDSLLNSINKNLVELENVYIETDRNFYLAGDTIWFSAFVLDNRLMDSTSLSKILYVDLINTKNKLEKHLKLLIINGRAKGDFIIDRNAENGKYRLRAYTQYMRNFQGEFLFEKDIPVYQSDFMRNILVSPVIKKSTQGDSVDLYIQTILPDEYISLEKKLEVRALLKDTLTISKVFDFKKVLNGFMGFFVPSSLHCSSIDILLTLSGNTIISTQRISLELNSDIILQFYPESGKLIDGIETVVAFKASNGSGDPAEFTADITDEEQRQISHIKADRTGIGKFTFTPELDHIYKAHLISRDVKYAFNLPPTEPTGYLLNFDPVSGKLSVKTNKYSLKGSRLLAFVRGKLYTATEIKSDTSIIQMNIPLEGCPRGIVQLTLFDSLFRPQAERLVFNNHQENKILIQIETDRKEYMRKEKVNLTIRCSDAYGNPVQSSLSLSVVDQSGINTLINTPDIESYLYIASELKGEIDYGLLNLSDTTQRGIITRDLIMMTQGWRNFLWNSIRYVNATSLLYPIEKGFFLDGTVSQNIRRRSDRNYNLNFLDYNSGFNGVTKIDKNHKFEIDIPLFYDSHVFIIQNRNNKNRVENLGIHLDTISFPEIEYSSNTITYNSNKTAYPDALNYRFTELDSLFGKEIKYINLPEVKVKAKSHYSYSTPDIIIDLNKTDPSGKKYSSLFGLIYEEFGEKAFTAIGFNAKGKIYNPILVVDGYPHTALNCPPCYSNDYDMAARIPVNQISDIKFYEAGSNFSKWLTPPPRPFTPPKEMFHPMEHLDALPVVSITTYSDSYRGNPKGTVVFPFQGIYQAREFYQPVGSNKNRDLPDKRITIYWNPELKTDSTGVSRISFYNSDLKGKSLIRVSGVCFGLKEVSSAFSCYLSR